ncbi:MAG: hypothetical protein LBQ87_01085 [Candidatus Fibromonas sp.]|nr:hypothetical protein [Candidatus Fibromonas sp.]
MMESIHSYQADSVAKTGGIGILMQKNKAEEAGPENNPENEEDSKDYKLSFSEEGWDIFEEKDKDKDGAEKKGDGKDSKDSKDSKGLKELSEEEQRKIDELEKIDRKVRTHEQAHLSAAGGYARGGANYDYVTGPDGKRYANSGHVNIDTSPENTPEATIRKAEIVRKAALAPAEPSPSDRQIAADAEKMSQNAQRELAEQQAMQ